MRSKQGSQADLSDDDKNGNDDREYLMMAKLSCWTFAESLTTAALSDSHTGGTAGCLHTIMWKGLRLSVLTTNMLAIYTQILARVFTGLL